MSALKRMMAAVLAIISVAVAVHFIAGEIYGVYWSDSNAVWDYLNWFIAMAMLVALGFHFRRKRAFDRLNREENVTLGYLSTNFLFLATILLTLWFFANWFEELNASQGASSTVVSFVWISFNASFVVLVAVTAWLLWNTEEENLSGETAIPAEGSPPAAQADPSATVSTPVTSEMPSGRVGAGRVGRSPSGGIIDGGAVNLDDASGSVQGR